MERRIADIWFGELLGEQARLGKEFYPKFKKLIFTDRPGADELERQHMDNLEKLWRPWDEYTEWAMQLARINAGRS